MAALVRFTAGGQRFGLSLAQVGELAETPVTATVPGAPGAIRGIADIRGRIVTLLDLARLLGLSLGAPSAECRALILAEPLAHIALVVDRDVRIDEEDCRPLDIGELLERCSELLREKYRLAV